MNIVIINTFYLPDGQGGAERSVSVLAEGLVDQGHKVSVLCTSNTRRVSWVKGVNVFGCGKMNIFWIGADKNYTKIMKLIWHFIDAFNIVSFFRCLFLIKKIRPEVIHTNNVTGFSVSVFLVAKILKIPTVHTLRDYYLGCLTSNAVGCGKKCIRVKYISRIFTKLVDVVVGNSKYILDWHVDRNYFNKASKYVVFNGYAYDGEALTKRQPEDGYVYGFIGNLSPDKGIDILCKQFKYFQSQKKTKSKLLIAGTGDPIFVRELKKLHAQDNLIFLGYLDPVEFYKKIDWNVVPSIWNEPLARVCFEPKFFGIPVISSNKGGNSEAVNHKFDGLLFDPDLSNDLFEKLCLSLRVDYEIYCKNSLEDRGRFSIENVTSEYESIYSELIRGNRV